MKNKNIIIIIATVLLGIIYLAGTQAYKDQVASNDNFFSSENFELYVPKHAMKLGNDKSKVYLTEFLDIECESCRQFYPYVKKILEDHPGQAQLVIRYATFHKNSKYVTQILEAARMQGKYWEVMDTLFVHQPEWGNHHNPNPELIWGYLEQLGVDIAKIKEDMNDPAILKLIEQDGIDGKQLNVRQTPTFFVNGIPLQEFGYEGLRDLIRSQIEKNKS